MPTRSHGSRRSPREVTEAHGSSRNATGATGGHGRPREATGGHGKPREATGGHGRPREATMQQDPREHPETFVVLSYRGPPWGDPPQPIHVLTLPLQLHCCIGFRIIPLLYLLFFSSVTLLGQTCSFLLPACCFSCTFLASRSMIAQVSTFAYKTNGKPYILGNKGLPVFHTISQKVYKTSVKSMVLQETLVFP